MNGFRTAANKDAGFLVPLVSESSGGVWPAVWRALADAGESVEQSAIRYLTKPSNKLSVKNTTLAEANDSRVGAMIIYQEDPVSLNENDDCDQPPLPRDLFDALQPYRELSDPNSLFIAEICLLHKARGQGLGSRFLDYAKKLTIEKKLPRVSLRVFSANLGAVRLYERNGFQIEDQRPVIAHPDIKIEESVLLMSCSV
ncbi:MAG: GNAT family N-acetyltransferase [Woeseia sp.]|nr:GNAT family N-acetyltransferase [Woeseia sp.]